MSLRVLYHYSTPQFNTGSPKALVGLIDALDRSCIEPLFLASSDGPLVDALAERGVGIVRGPVASVSYRRPLVALRQIGRQASLLRSHRVDVVHVNELGWNTDLVLGAWTRGIPVILHMQNSEPIEVRNLNRVAARKILLVSEAQAADIAHFERIRHKCAVLNNPADLAACSRGRSIRPALGLAHDHLVVGTVAQVCRRKGIDLLLDVARILLPEFPRLVFVIAGPVGHQEDAFAERMMQLAQDPAFDGRVRFLGPRSDVPDVLASTDVFFLPTRAEGFPVAVLEAMAAGLPVVASDVSGIHEMIAAPELGWRVPPDSLEGFTAALRTVLRLPDRGKAVGERGRRSVYRRFDSATVRRKLEALYRGLCGPAATTRGRTAPA